MQWIPSTTEFLDAPGGRRRSRRSRVYRPKAVMRETPCDRLRWTLLLVAWEKQALYGHPSKPNRIGHAIRHQVQKLLADNNSQLAIVGIIAEGSTTYFLADRAWQRQS